jgi:hypothetical protein
MLEPEPQLKVKILHLVHYWLTAVAPVLVQQALTPQVVADLGAVPEAVVQQD